MIVQIFDIFDSETALKLVDLGVDHIGIPVIPENPKAGVSNEKAKEIINAIDGKAKSVIMTLSSNIADLSKLIEEVNPDVLQLQASLEELDLEKLKQIRQLFPGSKIMRALPVQNESIIDIAKTYENFVDLFLLDSVGKQFGTTGKVHDWNISRKIVENSKIPVILAGGLGPDNVREAIEKVKPYGVDSKTKTDIGGSLNKKDFEKVKEFVRIAKDSS